MQTEKQSKIEKEDLPAYAYHYYLLPIVTIQMDIVFDVYVSADRFFFTAKFVQTNMNVFIHCMYFQPTLLCIFFGRSFSSLLFSLCSFDDGDESIACKFERFVLFS